MATLLSDIMHPRLPNADWKRLTSGMLTAVSAVVRTLVKVGWFVSHHLR